MDEPRDHYDPGWDVDSTHFGLGWCWYRSPPEMVDQFNRAISFPYWALAVVSAIRPVLLLRRWRRDRAGPDDQRLCAVCSYDLRATPARCPECGTLPR